MDLEAARKTLSKGSAFSSKRIAFLAVAGLALVVGIAWRASHYLGETPAEEKAPVAVEVPEPAATAPPAVEATEPVAETPPAMQEAAPAPSAPAEQAVDTVEQAEPASDAAEQAEGTGDSLEQAEQREPVDPSVILVSKRPVEVLSGPSASAPALYGFPAGRPFRVVGRDGGFVHIRDLRSGATGWIEEAALAPAKRAPEAAPPSQAKPAAGGRKPATTSAESKPPRSPQAASEPSQAEPAQTRQRPGLFGKDGLFGGIFRGGN